MGFVLFRWKTAVAMSTASSPRGGALDSMAAGDRRGADEAAARTAQGGVAKLPYGGLNRIRFEGSVSTGATWKAGRYPRFGVHLTMRALPRSNLEAFPARRFRMQLLTAREIA